MNGRELLHLLRAERTDEPRFIKWRNPSEGTEYVKLVDEFCDDAKIGDNFEDVQLLDIEGMWAIVSTGYRGDIARTVRDGDDVVSWEEVAPDGQPARMVSKFAPDCLIRIFEATRSDRDRRNGQQ